MGIIQKIKSFRENDLRTFDLLFATALSSITLLGVIFVSAFPMLTNPSLAEEMLPRDVFANDIFGGQNVRASVESKTLTSYSGDVLIPQSFLRAGDTSIIEEMKLKAEAQQAREAEELAAKAATAQEAVLNPHEDLQQAEEEEEFIPLGQNRPVGPKGAPIIIPSSPCDIETIAFGTSLAIHPQDPETSVFPTIYIPSGADLRHAKVSFSKDVYDSFPAGALKNMVILQTDKASAPVEIGSNATVDLSVLFSDFAMAPEQHMTVTMLDTPGVPDVEYAVMKSDNVASIYVTSKSPASKGIQYVEKTKGNKAKCSVSLVDESGVSELSDIECDYIKTRGNSTFWSTFKKSYQIKTSEKTDLLGIGEPAKKWNLISLCFDQTFIRNAFFYTLSHQIGLEETPDWRLADLYYDGEYRGLYMICEKVGVGETRVDITDLEDANDSMNADNKGKSELDDKILHPRVNSANRYGCPIQYIGNMEDPADITGGYLIELDDFFYIDEDSWFQTSMGEHFTVSSPECASKREVEYISGFIEEIYACLMNGGIHPTTQKKLFDYIDKKSFTKYFYIQELSNNSDAYRTSTYFYKPAGENKLYVGPVWDMDTTLGSPARIAPAYDCSGWKSGRVQFSMRLMNIPEFREALDEVYKSDMKSVVESALSDGGLFDKLTSIVYQPGMSDRSVWGVDTQSGRYLLSDTYEDAFVYAKEWSKTRSLWLTGAIDAQEFSTELKEATPPALVDVLAAQRAQREQAAIL